MVFGEVICCVGNSGFARTYVTTSHLFIKCRYFLILRNEIPKSLKAGMLRHKLHVFAHLTVSTTHIVYCELFCPGVMFSMKVIFSLNFSLHH